MEQTEYIDQDAQYSGLTSKNSMDKYLTFKLGREDYGIPILKVREIIGIMPINELPSQPPFIKGVINLRDHVIPVLCLRQKFGMEEKEYGQKTCIVVTEVVRTKTQRCWVFKNCSKENCPGYENSDLRCWMISGTLCRDETQGAFAQKIHACRACDYYKEMQELHAVNTIGIIVDGVSEVLAIKNDSIEEPPQYASKTDNKVMQGIAKTTDGVKILLDIDHLLDADKIVKLAMNNSNEDAQQME